MPKTCSNFATGVAPGGSVGSAKQKRCNRSPDGVWCLAAGLRSARRWRCSRIPGWRLEPGDVRCPPGSLEPDSA